MSNSQANHAAKPTGGLDGYFKISARGSSVRQEVVAGLTTFLAMVYSVIVVPSMLGKAGFAGGGVRLHLPGGWSGIAVDGVVG